MQVNKQPMATSIYPSAGFELLTWDSEFFGYRVATIDVNAAITTGPGVVEQLFANNVRLAYYAGSKPLDIADNDLFEIKLVDRKVTYAKLIEEQAPQHVVPYTQTYPDEALMELAVRSGKYSRFSVDSNIDPKHFRELYRQWIIKSVSKELADEVLVYQENEMLMGFVTIGKKNGRADIGIIAVDERFGRRGIGRALMSAAEHYASKNFTAIQVVTQADNIAACKLYEHCGFRPEKLEYFYHLWKKD